MLTSRARFGQLTGGVSQPFRHPLLASLRSCSRRGNSTAFDSEDEVIEHAAVRKTLEHAPYRTDPLCDVSRFDLRRPLFGADGCCAAWGMEGHVNTHLNVTVRCPASDNPSQPEAEMVRVEGGRSRDIGHLIAHAVHAEAARGLFTVGVIGHYGHPFCVSL